MTTLIESTKATYHQSYQTHQTRHDQLQSEVVVLETECNEPIKCQPQSSSATLTDPNNNKSAFIEIDQFINAFLSLSTVILDCRVLRDYELNHIKNSIHISCRDKITRKRLSSKKLLVKDIISCEAARKSFDDKLIVIYDEHTTDPTDLLLDFNPLKVVLDNLKQSCNTKTCKILKGGFNKFSEKCPEFCEKINLPMHLKNQFLLTTKTLLNFNLNCLNNGQTDTYIDLANGIGCIEAAKMSQILPYLYLGN
jgi:hypothetical protein